MFKLCILLLCLGATVSVPAPQRFKFLGSKKHTLKTIRIGSTTNIDCETTDAAAVVTLWKSADRKWVQVKPSYNLIQIGQMFTMHNFGLEDVATYECRAQDSMNTNISKTVVLLPDNYVPGLSLRSPNPLVTLTGSTVSFTCEAVVGTIVWHVKDMKWRYPKPSKYTIKNTGNASVSWSVLTIKNAQVSNSGIYECWLYYHDVKLSRDVLLTVKDSKIPSFVHGNSQPEIMTVKLGQSKHLNCAVNGFPKPTVSWEKDGIPISLCRRLFLQNCQSHGYLFQPHGMEIKRARFPQDNGTYTCVARSSVGVSRKDFQVVVEVKPVLDKSKSLALKSSTVTCHAISGSPPPKFYWFMQFYWFPMTKKPDEKRWFPISKYGNTAVVSRDGMKSTVRVPSMITRAFYKCIAVNKAGQDSHIIKMMRMF